MATLNRYLRCTRVQIAFISETRCGLRKAEERIDSLPLCNSLVVPSEGRSGGLWMVWGDEVDISLVTMNRSVIAVKVREKFKNNEWLL